MSRLLMDYDWKASAQGGEVIQVTCPYCQDGRMIVGLEAAFAWGKDHADTMHPTPVAGA